MAAAFAAPAFAALSLAGRGSSPVQPLLQLSRAAAAPAPPLHCALDAAPVIALSLVGAAWARRARRRVVPRAAGHRAGAPVKWAGDFEKALAEKRSEGLDTKEYAIERFCPMKLGKRTMPEELDLLSQIEGKDPGLPERMGLTQEQMSFRFKKIRDLLMEELGCSEMAASICVAQAARGKDLQNAGRPVIPAPKRVKGALNWLLQTTHANKEDGSLRACVEKYPFLLSKSIEDFVDNRELCPEGIDYAYAILFRPRNVDKTFQCGGVCKSRCGSCWYS